MSEFEGSNLESEEAPAPAPEAVAPVAAEDDIPEAITVTTGERMVPVAALRAVREELKSRPKAEDYAALKQQLDEARPYAEFLRNNPHLMAPPQAPAAPVVQPQDDVELIELAKTLELYDASTGRPDTKRAEVIRNMTRTTAQQIAQQTMAPVQERTYEQQAAQNLHAVANTFKDADGRTIDTEFMSAAIKTITASLPKAEAMRVLADPTVANVVGLVAQGLQAQSRKTPAQPVQLPPALHVESAGGQTDIQMSEGSRRLMKATGRSESEWTAAAKKYTPGRSNVLE
jgi:hypothetical protein